MALFGKKRNVDADAQKGEVEETKAKKAKPKKRRGKGAADILDETVLESALDVLRGNEAFSGQRDGEPVYIALCVMLDDIGGLDRKSLRDEEKGQLIEGINHGKIRALVTPELLEEGRLILIPTPDTLRALRELSLLADPTLTYRLVAIDDAGNIEDLSVGVEFDEVFDIGCSEDQSIMDTLAEVGVDWAERAMAELSDEGDFAEDAFDDVDDIDDIGDIDEIDFDPADVTVAMDAAGADEAPVAAADDGDIDFGDGAPVSVDAAISSPSAPQPVPEDSPAVSGPEAVVAAPAPEPALVAEAEPAVQSAYGAAGVQAPAMEAQAPQASVEAEPVSRERILQETNRLFFDEDLGIEVTTDPFDAHFSQMEDFVGFEEPDETWLDGYVAEMVRNANSELRRLHQSNLLKAKNMYLRLVQSLCEKLDADLSYNNDQTQYGRLYREICKKQEIGRANLERAIADRRDSVAADWKRRAEEEAEAAAAEARRSFETRQGRVREAELHRIEREEREKVEDHFADDVREMHSARRAEAQKRLGRIMNEVVAQVSEHYMADLEAEHEQYKRFRDEMNAFIDAARADQVAHDKVLAEELRQNERAEYVVRDYKNRLEVSQREAKAVADKLRLEIEDMQRRNEALIAEKDREIDDIQAGHSRERESLESQLAEMQRQYAELDEKKEQEWAVRVKAVTDERDMWASQTNALVESHKHQRGVTIALVVAAVVAALAIGFVAGIMGDFSQPAPVEVEAHVSTPYDVEDVPVEDGAEPSVETPAEANGQSVILWY